MPTVIERACEKTARYVWIYQDHIAPGDICPILEICEVQVFGCETGYYGDHCRHKCDHCMNKANCGIKDGRCDESGCATSGYQPPLCKACLNDTYGNDCEYTCGHCYNHVVCDRNNNTCSNGCGQDYSGSDCKQHQFVRSYSQVKASSIDGARWTSYAVDGNFNQSISHCFHSDVNDTIKDAWLRVDLGRVFSVSSVKLWYRSDGEFGSSWIKKSRLPGFSIRVSNDTTVPTSHSSCYTSLPSENMSTVIERDCEKTAKYVWIYQDHISPGDECPILEICEVQVFGCETGYYGDHCRHKCDHCMNKANCGIKDGRCDELGCAASGYQPPLCRACLNDAYGSDCEYTCGHCFNNASCDTRDGTCLNGCEKGYRGSDCKQHQAVKSFYQVKASSVDGARWASYAVDGDFNQSISHCFHSGVNETIEKAWLRIDLGRVFSVSSVKLWYRSDEDFGSSLRKKSRLPGFSIRVSNDTTVPTSISSCYTSLQSDDMRTIIERDCERTTRYVWIYQDHISPGDICPILEICEVQVFGCEIGYYGDHCRHKCDHCMNKAHCGIKDGRCDGLGCSTYKYEPPLCTACSNDKYGGDCEYSCGNCYNNAYCDKDERTCSNGCRRDQRGSDCKQHQVIRSFTQIKASSTHGARWASYAVDGDFNQSISHCFHSEVNKTIKEAWLRIDLGRELSVSSVKLWYRSDKTFGSSWIKKSRLPGFSVRVSKDTTVPTSISSCYTSLQSDDIPTVIERDCERTARYVWIYQDHISPGDEYPILEICEVQVFGCDTGYYGDHCRHKCDHCMNKANCGIKDGRCDKLGCATSGYQPPLCTACLNDAYGDDCEYTCGHCFNNASCDRNEGTCSNGCEKSYNGSDCRQHQIVRSFSQVKASSIDGARWASYAVDGDFSQRISHCFHSGVNETIKEAWLRIDLGKVFSVSSVKLWYRNDTGFGSSWIKKSRLPGFSIRVSNDTTVPTSRPSCYISLPSDDLPTVVERDCERTARYVWIYQNHTAAGDACPILEICEIQVFGCETGYYGDHCRHKCDHCMNKANCGIKDGSCDESGCATSGYQPPLCIACLKDKYGNDCEYTCGHCYNNASCDRNDGTCSNGCEKGYRGSDCKQRDLGNSLMTINSTTERLKNTSQLLISLIEGGTQDTKQIQETVNATLYMMENTISPSKEISTEELNSTLDILDKIVNITGPAIENKVFYTVIDNILSTNNSKSWTTLIKEEGKGASFVLRNMDKLNEILMDTTNATTTNFTGSNLELSFDHANLEEKGIRFPEASSSNISDNANEMSTFLELPKQNKNSSKEMQYVAILYKILPELLSQDHSRTEKQENKTTESKPKTIVNSAVLSLTTKNDVGILDPPLALTFRHIVNNELKESHQACVSWDFKESKWTERGCKVKLSNLQKTVCLCNHLTNFAILMRPYSTTKEESNVLKTMSFVGVVLSIAFAFITFVIYIITWRYIKSEQNIMMLNMCGALIMSLVMFITLVEKTNDGNACIAITAIIHYLFLVTFFSMLGIGVYYFMSITVTFYAMYVANNFKSKPRIHWFLIGAWGFSAIITAINLGVFWGKGYHLKNYCWLSMESGSLYLFIIPVCLINLLNVIIIVSLLRVLYASRTMAKSSLQKKASSALRSLGTLVPVLGVTWIFGIFAVDHKTDIFQYIFVIANSLQGLFIFVTHVLLNNKVRQGLCNVFQKLKTVATSSGQINTKTSAIGSQSLSTINPHLLKNKENVMDETVCSENAEKSDLKLVVEAKVEETPGILPAEEWGEETGHKPSFLFTYTGPK
nr:uncharacterized protein LOC105317649 [Crassostrea gigas]